MMSADHSVFVCMFKARPLRLDVLRRESPMRAILLALSVLLLSFPVQSEATILRNNPLQRHGRLTAVF